MIFDRDSAFILLLLTLPFQYNLITDSLDLIISDMKNGRITGLSYYQNYFAKKIIMYCAIISTILFIFIFYKYRKVKLIISISFFVNGITWLIYFGVTDNTIYVLYIIRALQGFCLGIFQLIDIPYIMHFAKSTKQSFCGCLIQFSMFCGLFIMNLLFNFFNWKTVVIIFFLFSVFCGCLIWKVPELPIKPKSMTNEHIYHKEHIKPIFVMMTIMLLQQLSGIVILLTQLSEMLVGIGVNIGGHLQTCLFDFVGALATMIAAFVSSAVSTRILWAFSALGLCIGLTIYCISIKTDTANWVGILGAFFYFLFYGLGEGPIPWYLCGTMFNDNVRIESSGINLCWNHFLAPIIDLIWDKLDDFGSQFGSIIFAIISCFIAIFFGLIFIPNDKSISIGDATIM